MSKTLPHRTLRLTQATTPDNAPAVPLGTGHPNGPIAAWERGPFPGMGPADSNAAVVRVMAYLTTEESDILDALWLRLRRHPARPSKSDLLRAALTLAASDPEKFAETVAQQHDSTLSRQRNSMTARQRGGGGRDGGDHH